ncbi:MAG: hypothetical protein MRY21_07260 [Simkaniaceae bacterium]|nr:hypothetical protein [Simkaniaceae bacterium]
MELANNFPEFNYIQQKGMSLAINGAQDVVFESVRGCFEFFCSMPVFNSDPSPLLAAKGLTRIAISPVKGTLKIVTGIALMAFCQCRCARR